MTLVHKFAFVSSWKCLTYAKISTYVQYLFKESGIPYIIVDTPADLQTYVNNHPEERIIVVYMFSYTNIYSMPVHGVEYLMFILDPKHNLDKTLLHNSDMIRRAVCGFVTLTTIEDDYFQRHWPGKPVFHLFQGYVPYEDFGYTVDMSKKLVDVVAPGFKGFCGVSGDRCAVVQKLRERGLIVNDNPAFDADLNKSMEDAKVCIYYPWDKRYVTWHGQRTLWAVNKQICVITTETSDRKCEDLYSKSEIYLHAPWNIDQFVDTVVKVVQSGRWKQFGINAHYIYKTKYHALELFQGPFYSWCHTITNTLPLKNMPTTYTFAFIRSCKCMLYGRLENYFQYIFKHKNIPHIVVETGADVQNYMKSNPNEKIIVVYMFSYIIPYGWPVQGAQYLIVVSDPEHNLDVGLQDRKAVEQNVCGFVSLTTIIDGYLQRHWPTKPIFHFFQGYVAYEDFGYTIDPSKKTVDVVASGWEAYHALPRGEVVQKLRARGLTVDDKRAYGKDFDTAITKAKVSICYPFDQRYGTWHGQRTLWAVNKQSCVITTPSKDETCERFYSNGIYIQAPWDIDKFVDVVVDVVKSGRWKQAGIDGHANYKRHYNALQLFEGPFYNFCQTMTKTLPSVIPIAPDSKFRFCIQPGARWFRFYFMPFLLLHFPDITLVNPNEVMQTQVHGVIDGFNDPSAAGILEYKGAPNLKIILVSGEPYGTSHDFVHLIIDCKRDPNRLPKNVPWIYLPNYVMGFGERFHHPKELLLPPNFDRKDAIKLMKTKTKFCAFLYSNPVPFRDQFFHDMAKHYKSADALGGCCNPNAKPRGETDRIAYNGMVETFYDTAVKKYEPYKFVIAFENSDILGYITEKLVNPVLARAIPIYFGAPDIFSDGVFNPKSMIHMRDFPSYQACIEYVKKVDQDPELFLEYLQQPLFKGNKLPRYFDSDYLLPAFMNVFKK